MLNLAIRTGPPPCPSHSKHQACDSENPQLEALSYKPVTQVNRSLYNQEDNIKVLYLGVVAPWRLSGIEVE